MMRCKILEVGPDDCLQRSGIVGKKGSFDRKEYKIRKWLSGWFVGDNNIRLYFLQVRIEPEVIWE